MKREVWPFALVVVFAVFLMAGAATAQEAEPTEEAESAAEAKAAPEPTEAAEAEEAEAAPEPASTEFTQTVKFSPLSQASLDGAAGEIDGPA